MCRGTAAHCLIKQKVALLKSNFAQELWAQQTTPASEGRRRKEQLARSRVNRMLSGLKGPDPPPQPCSAATLWTALSAQQIPPREKRDRRGVPQRGYPARCPHCNTAAGKEGVRARLCYPRDLVAHKSWFPSAWEAPSTMSWDELIRESGCTASQEGDGTAPVRTSLDFPVPSKGSPVLAGTGTWSWAPRRELLDRDSSAAANAAPPDCWSSLSTHWAPFPCHQICNFLPKRDARVGCPRRGITQVLWELQVPHTVVKKIWLHEVPQIYRGFLLPFF